MATHVRLIYPLAIDGRIISAVTVRRPNLMAFRRYWRDRHSPPDGMLSISAAEADQLHPSDMHRVVSAAADLTRPYAIAFAVIARLTGRRATPKRTV